MTRKLIEDLNGGKSGQLKMFLDEFKGDPRIAWYPSAGQDFHALLYLHPMFSQIHPASRKEPEPPDLFIFTDYFPWQNSAFLDNRTVFSDKSTTVYIDHIEELPRLNLPLHNELVHFINGSAANNRVVNLNARVDSDKLGAFSFPVIYAFVENETFYCNKIVPNNADISHLIHVRYGGGCGGGGKASGAWLLNVLGKLNCELFITDGSLHWQSGDEFALQLCSLIPRQSNSKLSSIRTIPSKDWSHHGDVSWNLVH